MFRKLINLFPRLPLLVAVYSFVFYCSRNKFDLTVEEISARVLLAGAGYDFVHPAAVAADQNPSCWRTCSAWSAHSGSFPTASSAISFSGQGWSLGRNAVWFPVFLVLAAGSLILAWKMRKDFARAIQPVTWILLVLTAYSFVPLAWKLGNDVWTSLTYRADNQPVVTAQTGVMPDGLCADDG